MLADGRPTWYQRGHHRAEVRGDGFRAQRSLSVTRQTSSPLIHAARVWRRSRKDILEFLINLHGQTERIREKLTSGSKRMSESCCYAHHRLLEALTSKRHKVIMMRLKDLHHCICDKSASNGTWPLGNLLTSTRLTSADCVTVVPTPSCPNALEPHDKTRPESTRGTEEGKKH